MERKASSVNFNSILGIIAIGVMGWTGSSVLKLSEKMTRVETLLEERNNSFLQVEKRVQTIEAVIWPKAKVP